jgi:diacylglycerol kinase family enzyme
VARRSVLVVNPRASAVTERGVDQVASVLRPDAVVRTERPGHATEIVRAVAGEHDVVYVFSGDGGFNEALNGVDGDTPLGLVPGGGASVLPRALGLPRDPVAAARRLLDAGPRRISVGVANGRRFGFAAGLGLDAEIVRRVDERGRRPDGRRAGNVTFAWLALRTLAAHRFRIPAAVELADHGPVAFVLAANCDPYTYAGRLPLRLAPLARFEAGLDVVAPRRLAARHLPRYARYAATGRGQERAADVVYLHDVDRAEARASQPLPLHVDGEDLGDVTELVLTAERAAVLVLA